MSCQEPGRFRRDLPIIIKNMFVADRLQKELIKKVSTNKDVYYIPELQYIYRFSMEFEFSEEESYTASRVERPSSRSISQSVLARTTPMVHRIGE